MATAVLLLTSGCGQKSTNRKIETPETTGPVKGVDRSHAGTPLSAIEVNDPSGKPAELPDPGGKPMLVNFWASWCGPCIKELPTLQTLSLQSGAPRIVEVSEDMAPRASVDAFLKAHGIDKLKSWQDPKSAITTALGAEVLPTTIYYNGQGREVWRYVGDLDWTGPEAAKLLADSGSAAVPKQG